MTSPCAVFFALALRATREHTTTITVTISQGTTLVPRSISKYCFTSAAAVTATRCVALPLRRSCRKKKHLSPKWEFAVRDSGWASLALGILRASYVPGIGNAKCGGTWDPGSSISPRHVASDHNDDSGLAKTQERRAQRGALGQLQSAFNNSRTGLDTAEHDWCEVWTCFVPLASYEAHSPAGPPGDSMAARHCLAVPGLCACCHAHGAWTCFELHVECFHGQKIMRSVREKTTEVPHPASTGSASVGSRNDDLLLCNTEKKGTPCSRSRIFIYFTLFFQYQ